MLYCGRCQLLCSEENTVCGTCGREVRMPKPNDPVLLIKTDLLHGNMIEPLLKDHQMPYSKIGERGAGLSMYGGSMLETYRFYVPYGAYVKVRELIVSALGEDEDVMNALR